MSTTRTTSVANLSLQTRRLIETDYAVHRTGDGHSCANAQSNTILPTSALNSSAAATVARYPSSDGLIDPTTAPHPRVQGVVSPACWPSNRFRRVPEYAPVNYELDMSERPVGENAIIGFFLTTTFTGCHFLSVSVLHVLFGVIGPGKRLSCVATTEIAQADVLQVYSSLWRRLTGRYGEGIFRYEVGGEF